VLAVSADGEHGLARDLARPERSEGRPGFSPIDYGTDRRAKLPAGHELGERGEVGADARLVS